MVRLSSSPTFSYYSYLFVLFLLFPKKFLLFLLFCLSNAKMMIGLRKSHDHIRKQHLPRASGGIGSPKPLPKKFSVFTLTITLMPFAFPVLLHASICWKVLCSIVVSQHIQYAVSKFVKLFLLYSYFLSSDSYFFLPFF